MLRQLSTRRSWLWLTAILTGALLLIAPATPAAAAGSVTPMVWHRYNIYEPISPSHERLRCLTDGQWRCLYDTVPEPTLGFTNPLVKGTFIGTDITDSWECPEADWFPTDICDSAAQVVSGTQSFVFPGFGQLFAVDAVYIVTDDGTLWNYWVDQFVCPWYPTFDEALTTSEGCTFNPALPPI
jgi:hypothetical protein